MLKHVFAVCILAGFSADCAASSVRVVDPDGVPVEQFELMFHTEHHGYGLWEPAQAGVADVPSFDRKATSIDLIVRSKDFATEVVRYSGEDLDRLRRGDATITMRSGLKSILQLNPAHGPKIPDDCLPQTWFPDYANRVQMMWQATNLRRGTPDFNFLNLTPIGGGRFSFRVPDSKPFYVGIFHPGYLRYFQCGPFDDQSIKDGLLEIDVPPPATIHLTYDRQESDEKFVADASCQLYWRFQSVRARYSMPRLNSRFC